MNPLEGGRKRLEKDEENAFRKLLVSKGWHVEKTHGSLYMKGWPDLYCIHPAYGPKWIEVKRPGEGKLEDTQVKKFNEWRKYGLGVWVVTGVKDYPLIFKQPNWHHFLDPALRRLYRVE